MRVPLREQEQISQCLWQDLCLAARPLVLRECLLGADSPDSVPAFLALPELKPESPKVQGN